MPTFGEIYNKTTRLNEPLSKGTRYTLIAEELDRYKRQMAIRSTKPRSRRWKIAALVIVSVVCILLGFRVFQEIFLIDPFLGVYGLIVGFMIFTSFFCSYVLYKDPALKQSTIKSLRQPLVSVVIAVKNDPFIISDAVNSCLHSSYSNLEIIVVDDGSDDNGKTAETLDRLQRENLQRVKVVHLIKNKGKRKAINIGIRAAAHGEVLILLDSDTIVERDAIKHLVKCIVDDDDLGAVVGYCRPLNVNTNRLTRAQDTWYHGAFTIGKGMEGALGTVTCCSGTLSAYRMAAVLPCLDAWSNDRFMGVEFLPGDDRQLTALVIGGTKYHLNKHEKQWKSAYCESAISISEIPTTFKKFINQQIRWKKSWVRVFCFTAPYFYKNRHPVSVVYYYLQMGISFVAPLIALRNLIYIPLTTGTWESAVIYLGGLTALSMLFAIDFKLYNPGSGNRWAWRIAITMLSVNCLHWLLYYAMATMRKTGWLTR